MMERIKLSELTEIRQDDREIRRFTAEISLKLRNRRSQNEDDIASLYEMVIDNS